MNRPKILALFVIAVLLAAPALAVVQDQGEVRVESLEAASGNTSGTLVGLLIDHFTPDLPVAAHGFRLDGSDVTVTANHVEAKVRTTSTPAEPRSIQPGGPATIEGVESRPELHFWITPLDDGASIEVRHRACTKFQQPSSEERTRLPSLNGGSNPLTVDASGTAQVASCTEALAVVTGNFSVTAWEWDMSVNGQRERSGVNDTAGSFGLPEAGAGSADELYITARDATLRIPLTAQTYELFIAQPRLEARELHLTNVEGTLPGILNPLDGVDVDLVGDYTVALDPATSPFTATIVGETSAASSDGVTLAVVQAPAGPASSASWVPWVVLASIAVVGAAGWNRYREPLKALYNHSMPPLDRGEPETRRGERSVGYCIMSEADAEHGRFKRARRRAWKAMRLDPENAYAPLFLGIALHELGRTEEAREAYLRAQREAHTTVLQCSAFMGEAQLVAGTDEEEAVRLLRQARAVNPRRAAYLAKAKFWDDYDFDGLVAAVRVGPFPRRGL